MTPDTLPIDVRIKGVGRIHRASGTYDRAVLRRMKTRMLPDLKSAARLDILRALRDGTVSFLIVFDAWTRNALGELPIGNAMPLVTEAMKTWITNVTADYSPEHVRDFGTTLSNLTKHERTAKIADLPRVLEELRVTVWAKKHPRSFNLARSHVQRFVRDTLKKSHPLYLAVAAVEPRKMKKGEPRAPLTPAAAQGFFPSPDAQTKQGRVDRVAWAMLTTGMGQKELWGRWEILSDRIHVYGTKRGGRLRDIPLVRAPAVPPLSRDRFEKNFRERMNASGITPYWLRHTYAQWMESAGIPRTRRRLYMGHGSKDITDEYEAHQISAFLAEDAAKLRAFLSLPDPPSIGMAVVK